MIQIKQTFQKSLIKTNFSLIKKFNLFLIFIFLFNISKKIFFKIFFKIDFTFYLITPQIK